MDSKLFAHKINWKSAPISKNASFLKGFHHATKMKYVKILTFENFPQMDMLENNMFYKLFPDSGTIFNLFHGRKVRKRQVL